MNGSDDIALNSRGRIRAASSRFQATASGAFLACLLVLANACNLFADTPPPLTVTDLQVTGAQSYPEGNSTIALGGSIDVTVARLGEFLSQTPAKQPKDFTLILDGRPIAALDVRRVGVAGADKDKLRFDLTSTRDGEPARSNQGTWDKLLGSPSLSLDYKRTLSVTVGFDNQPLDSKETIRLAVIPKIWGGVGLFVVLLVSLGLAALAWNTDLLKDPGQVESRTKPGTFRRPYSLSRAQLAIWFWVIFCSYVFIWVVNGETASLTGQVLGILGISSATLASSTAMSVRNGAEKQVKIDETKQKILDLTTKANPPNVPPLPTGGQPPAAATIQPLLAQEQKDAVKKQLDDLHTNLAALKSSPKDGSSGLTFLWDILSDENGISLPRFQVAAWTLVSVVIFLSNVWQKVSMPEFDGQMLALMGLSSGTYVGMKANEQPLAQPLVPAASEPPPPPPTA